MLNIELARVHSSAQIAFNSGANGGTISGVTATTPAVITTTQTHNLQDGDQVQVTGVGGTTTVNATAFAKVTGYSATTFGLYTTAALSTGVTGTGSYTSGGAVSEATDVSGLAAPWTLRLRVEALTAGTQAVIAIQDSADGFVNDIKTLAVVPVPAGSNSLGSAIEKTFPSYSLPEARIGVASGRVRLVVSALQGTGLNSVTTSLMIQN